MEKVDIKYNYFFDGKLYVDNEVLMVEDNEDFRNKKSKLTNKNNAGAKMESKAKKIGYESKIQYKNGNICGRCANLTRCPKINFNNINQIQILSRIMPYIQTALIVETSNNATRKRYEDALRRYQEIMDDEDKTVELEKLDEILEDNGSSIGVFTVYKCKKFIDDNVARLRSKRKC